MLERIGRAHSEVGHRHELFDIDVLFLFLCVVFGDTVILIVSDRQIHFDLVRHKPCENGNPTFQIFLSVFLIACWRYP